MGSELETRDAAAGAVAKAPRVTLAQLQSLIERERYVTDDALTICILTLKNGFKVTGESAAADPANFNEELGRKIARDKAVAEIWPLAGFLLREELHRRDHPAVMRCKVVLGSRMHAFRPKDGSWRTDPQASEVVLDGEQLHFGAVCPPTCNSGPDASPENLIFGEMTPNFSLTCHVRNAAVLERLERGQAYYVDFIPAPAA